MFAHSPARQTHFNLTGETGLIQTLGRPLVTARIGTESYCANLVQRREKGMPGISNQGCTDWCHCGKFVYKPEEIDFHC